MTPMQPEPRHFLTSPDRPGAGLPHDRSARLAARRSFVGLKQTFMQSVAGVAGPEGEWLRRQVRSAEDPIDLWLLRASVFAALRQANEPEGRAWRETLRRGLDSLFPDSSPGPASGFASF
jgi:hypothetical protein